MGDSKEIAKRAREEIAFYVADMDQGLEGGIAWWNKMQRGHATALFDLLNLIDKRDIRGAADLGEWAGEAVANLTRLGALLVITSATNRFIENLESEGAEP